MLASFALLALLAQHAFAHSSRPSPSPSSGVFRKRLIVFGDSLSDDGTGAWELSDNTLPVEPPYFEHQFTNGPVWSRLLAQKHNFELMSYAIGGATVDNDVVPGVLREDNSLLVPSVKDQVTQALAYKVPRTLDVYILFAGANDAVNALALNKLLSGTEVAALIEKRVSQLYKAGAKRVLLATLPNFAATPNAKKQPVQFRQFGTLFNEDLRTGLYNIVRRWDHLLRIEVADIYDAFNGVLANPEAFGFDSQYLTTPCYTGGYEIYKGTTCADPEKHIFWDGTHPSAVSHQLIADVFSEAYARL
ncbi:carbohydrate esterase family 16 protein [Cystobasidium minutum MCA 4210]|uniref:carbohydrate esterase family 16 protein n=1 Tax=Cystobasidium minutum MCA 4210 TaxID=1397322 RepID=UPI0034CF450C|eukprot:jgi/Rhomi1/202291/MIX3120_9_70